MAPATQQPLWGEGKAAPSPPREAIFLQTFKGFLIPGFDGDASRYPYEARSRADSGLYPGPKIIRCRPPSWRKWPDSRNRFFSMGRVGVWLSQTARTIAITLRFSGLLFRACRALSTPEMSTSMSRFRQTHPSRRRTPQQNLCRCAR